MPLNRKCSRLGCPHQARSKVVLLLHDAQGAPVKVMTMPEVVCAAHEDLSGVDRYIHPPGGRDRWPAIVEQIRREASALRVPVGLPECGATRLAYVDEDRKVEKIPIDVVRPDRQAKGGIAIESGGHLEVKERAPGSN